ncbi:hypothetical protein PCIT_a1300 [Pseudoalteromonas citrea]|uniref:Uncharacterized protein n=1 Tax=Pseudoalteromonas citrea TaxID=43655 RepID=A0AAD4AM58_9GAMM|nr:hypothetical protein PCIT_a1300 [Pseudoalteromonas citrea]
MLVCAKKIRFVGLIVSKLSSKRFKPHFAAYPIQNDSVKVNEGLSVLIKVIIR